MTHAPQMTGTKTCTKCGEDKPVICFPVQKDSVDGLYPICRPCISQARRPAGVHRKRGTQLMLVVDGRNHDPRGPVHTFEEWKNQP